MNRLAAIILALCLCIVFCDAQTNCDSILHLDSLRAERLKRSYGENLRRLRDYIEYMADSHQKTSNRRYYLSAALNMFIGRGNSYEEDGLTCDGATISVYSANGSSCSKYLVKHFLSNLINRMDHPEYTVIGEDIYSLNVCEFRPLSDDLYVNDVYASLSTCYGHRGGRPVYKDISRKRVKWYVKVEHTEDGDEYEVLLGDIIVIEGRRR